MHKFFIFLTFWLTIFPGLSLNGKTANFDLFYPFISGQKDSVANQILFNGRAWRNIYYKVQGNQFLFSEEFLRGSVTIDRKLFTDLVLKYDICNDEIITINKPGIIIQLNKEMIDLFTMESGDRTFYFQRLDTTMEAPFSGYVNILYEGNSSLFVRYRKEILKQTGDAVYEKFNQLHSIYFRKEGKFYTIRNKKDLLDLMSEKRQIVRSFIKNNRIKISKKDPWSFVPVVKYYDNLHP